MSAPDLPPSAAPAASGGLVALPARTPSEQLRMLLRLSEALASTATTEEVADTIGTLAQQFLGAVFGGVAVIDGATMHYLSLRPLPAAMQEQRRSFPLDSDRPAAVSARERRVMLVGSVDAPDTGLPAETVEAVHRVGGRALAFLPMFAGGRTVGAISLMWSHGLDFSSADRQVLMALARYTAQAFDRARLLAERREVAYAMQAALLPVLPRVDWLSTVAEYRPARATEAVGGDWYDVFAASRGPATTLVITVGDVTGHDLLAATEMARLQASLRALAVDRLDAPHELLGRLDSVMAATGSGRFATAVVATVSPAADGTVGFTWSNAGHPPPLLLAPGREPQYLERPSEPLLGLPHAAGTFARSSDRVVLAPGSTVLIFTDGLVERRGVDLDDALTETLALADMHRELPLPDLVDTMISLATGESHQDDRVVLALRTPA